jgi:hypothetical protein
LVREGRLVYGLYIGSTKMATSQKNQRSANMASPQPNHRKLDLTAPQETIMAASTANHSTQQFDAIYAMIEYRPDVKSLLRQIRESRLKLGAVLEDMDMFEPGPDALEVLRDCSEGVWVEVERINTVLKYLMGR